LAVVIRGVYKDMLLLSQEDRLMDFGELRKRVSCICYERYVLVASSVELKQNI